MKLQHFILTRFNIASGGREALIRKRPGWLERRFELFETYCIPSVASQSNRDFSWLIYFDHSTGEDVRPRIEKLRAQFPFQPLFVDGFHVSLAKKDVADHLDANAHKVLTTRLDNDDAIASDFVARLHDAAGEADQDTLLSFPAGYSLKGSRLYEAKSHANPFVSLVENSRDPRTVWFDQHQNLTKHWPVRSLETRAWMQIIHEDNVSNRVKGRLVNCPHPPVNFDVRITQRIDPSVGITRKIDRLIGYPIRVMREAVIRVAKRFLAPFKHP